LRQERSDRHDVHVIACRRGSDPLSADSHTCSATVHTRTVVCVATKYDPDAQNGGHGNLLESSRDRIRIRALIERTGRSKKRPVAGAPRGHISLEIKIHVRGTRNHSTIGSDHPYMRMTILYVRISRAIAGADAMRCRTPSEWTDPLSMPGMHGRGRKCTSLRAGLQGTALPYAARMARMPIRTSTL
jgi:hypothetical protein